MCLRHCPRHFCRFSQAKNNSQPAKNAAFTHKRRRERCTTKTTPTSRTQRPPTAQQQRKQEQPSTSSQLSQHAPSTYDPKQQPPPTSGTSTASSAFTLSPSTTNTIATQVLQRMREQDASDDSDEPGQYQLQQQPFQQYSQQYPHHVMPHYTQHLHLAHGHVEAKCGQTGAQPAPMSPNYCVEVANRTSVTFVVKLDGLAGVYGQEPHWGRGMATLGTRHGHIEAKWGQTGAQPAPNVAKLLPRGCK